MLASLRALWMRLDFVVLLTDFIMLIYSLLRNGAPVKRLPVICCIYDEYVLLTAEVKAPVFPRTRPSRRSSNARSRRPEPSRPTTRRLKPAHSPVSARLSKKRSPPSSTPPANRSARHPRRRQPMAAPSVVSVEPADSETDVILGTVIFVTFDQEIDPTTVTDATFSLTGPGQASRTRSLRPLPRKAPRAHAREVEDSQGKLCRS